MKYLLLSLLLVGSLASAKDITREYEGELPSPDCKVYRLDGDLFSKELFVVDCPHSDTSTTWRSGKTNSTGAMINE